MEGVLGALMKLQEQVTEMKMILQPALMRIKELEGAAEQSQTDVEQAKREMGALRQQLESVKRG